MMPSIYFRANLFPRQFICASSTIDSRRTITLFDRANHYFPHYYTHVFSPVINKPAYGQIKICTTKGEAIFPSIFPTFPNCAHVKCLVSLNIQQAFMNVNARAITQLLLEHISSDCRSTELLTR